MAAKWPAEVNQGQAHEGGIWVEDEAETGQTSRSTRGEPPASSFCLTPETDVVRARRSCTGGSYSRHV
jgi:hypothetical protein